MSTCRTGSFGAFIQKMLPAVAPVWFLLNAVPSYALFLDGDGHYAVRGESRHNPGFSKNSGTFQAIEQSFRLKGEARFNDMSSMFLEFGLFDNLRETYLGNTPQPNDCEPRRIQVGTREVNNPNPEDTAKPKIQVPIYETRTDCEGRYQNTGEPRYKPYTPKITQAYIRYAFDYCILEAGRRTRNWGLGLFLDDGSKPFSQDASVFDGATCNVNIQKSQTLGFSVGYDKLAETGTYVDNPYDYPYAGAAASKDKEETDFDSRSRRFGANDDGDDIDQYFFTIEYDDRKANAGAAFTKQVGVYFAQINSKKLKDGGSNTDLKFLDLYTGFFIGDLTFRNELFFRMGKSADPNWILLGGRRTNTSEDGSSTASNNLQAIAFAGSLEWTMSRSGAVIGPAEYNKGDASRHVLSFNYALAPGDSDGYLTNESDPNATDLQGTREMDRNDSVTAVAFHRNFKPALLLFNARPEADTLRVQGVFNPSRVLNANVFSLAYTYESQQIGNYEVKLVTARLDKGMPGAIKEYYDQQDASTLKPVGYKGKLLGYELDLTYTYKVGREVDLGLATAYAMPGNAWDTSDKKPATEFMVQSFAAFKF